MNHFKQIFQEQLKIDDEKYIDNFLEKLKKNIEKFVKIDILSPWANNFIYIHYTKDENGKDNYTWFLTKRKSTTSKIIYNKYGWEDIDTVINEIRRELF